MNTSESVCTLTSVSHLELESDSKMNNSGYDIDKEPSGITNEAFCGNMCDSESQITTVKQPIKFRGLSKNDVILRSKETLWSTIRQVFYILIFVLWTALIVTLIVFVFVHPKCRAQTATSWWQGAVYYRIYVPMFKDSNGDCKGDFQGIVSKLDYLEDLGVDVISLSPIYPEDSNDVEFSITNHTSVNTDYGDVQDLIDLIGAVHKRGMYLVLDFIPNMTGKQHKWFQESEMSSGRNRQNFYVWVNGNNIPNNWNAQANGSAWSFSSKRNATYLHQVDPSLPDLNLRSSIVLDKLNEILRYWMSLGVDGFNLRQFGLLLEDYDLRREPEAQPPVTNDTHFYEYLNHKYTFNLPENFYLLRLWHNVVNKFDNKTRILMNGMDNNGEEVALFESVYGPVDFLLSPYIIFWDPPLQCGYCIKNYIMGKLDEISLKNTAIWMLGNDMTSRLKSRLNNNVKRQEILTMIGFLLPGSVFLYNGDEIDMVDVSLTNSSIVTKSKPWRNPMLWDNTSYVGFSNSSCTSLPLKQNKTINVKNQLSSASSMLNFMKNLVRLRRDQGFRIGDFQYGLVDDDVFSFVRGFDGTDCYLVAANLSNKTITRNFASGPGGVSSDAKVKLLTPSSANDETLLGEIIDTSSISLGEYQGIVVKWSCGLRQ